MFSRRNKKTIYLDTLLSRAVLCMEKPWNEFPLQNTGEIKKDWVSSTVSQICVNQITGRQKMI